MEVRSPNEFPRETVYFTPADASFQRLGAYTPIAFERAMKTWVLLADTLVVAASHVFESSMAADLLIKNPRLLRDGIVVPSLRDDSMNFREFVHCHRDKGDQTAFFRANFDDLLAMGKFLDDTVSTAYSWTFGSSSDAFKASILLDLEEPQSALRRRLLGVRRQQLDGFRLAVDRMPYASRERLAAAADLHLPQRKAVLNSYWDTQYYLNSAAATANVPLLDVRSLSWMSDDFEQASSTAKVAHLPRAFDDLVSRMGLSSGLLDMLTMDDAIQLRHSPEGQAFRRAIWKATDAAGPDCLSAQAAAQQLLHALPDRLSADRSAVLLMEEAIVGAATLVGLSGFVLSHGPAILGMAAKGLEVAGVALTAVGAKPILERIRLRKDPLGAFLLRMRHTAEGRQRVVARDD